MRMLRLKGTNRVYIYTDILATHPDIEVFDTDGDSSVPPSPSPVKTPAGLAAALSAPPAPEQPSVDPTQVDAPQATNIHDITNPDTLRAMLRDRNVKVGANTSVETMQKRLAGLMTAESEAA